MPITDKIHTDTSLVHRLIDEQFPQWTSLQIKPVELVRIGDPAM